MLEKQVTSPVPDPKLIDGLDDVPDTLRDLVYTMAGTIDAAERNADVDQWIERLQALTPGGRMQQVLEQACDRLQEAAEDDRLQRA